MEQFIAIDPESGRVLWSHVIESGYVPSLGEVQRRHPGQRVLKIKHTPLLHDPDQQPLCVVHPGLASVLHPDGEFLLRWAEQSGEGWLLPRGWVPGGGRGPGR